MRTTSVLAGVVLRGLPQNVQTPTLTASIPAQITKTSFVIACLLPAAMQKQCQGCTCATSGSNSAMERRFAPTDLAVATPMASSPRLDKLLVQD